MGLKYSHVYKKSFFPESTVMITYLVQTCHLLHYEITKQIMSISRMGP